MLHFLLLEFDNAAALNAAKRTIGPGQSLEVDNAEAILGDIDLPSTDRNQTESI